MINKYVPHVLVLPEDDADRQIANGFMLSIDIFKQRAIQILPHSGGWAQVVDDFLNNHTRDMVHYSERRMILLIDFDNHFPDRLNYISERIPHVLSNRVFVLGTLSEPEKLKTALNNLSLENIGMALYDDCNHHTQNVWGNPLLKHNQDELSRLYQDVRPFLF
jgi:hypothetical protein